MGRYDDLRALLRDAGLEPGLEVLPPKSIEALRHEYPGLPEDYLDFLGEVGWGSLGDGFYMLYNRPITASEVYGAESASLLEGLLLVGDDFSGCNAGFLVQESGCVIEVEPVHRQVERSGQSFDQYVCDIVTRWRASFQEDID